MMTITADTPLEDILESSKITEIMEEYGTNIKNILFKRYAALERNITGGKGLDTSQLINKEPLLHTNGTSVSSDCQLLQTSFGQISKSISSKAIEKEREELYQLKGCIEKAIQDISIEMGRYWQAYQKEQNDNQEKTKKGRSQGLSTQSDNYANYQATKDKKTALEEKLRQVTNRIKVLETEKTPTQNNIEPEATGIPTVTQTQANEPSVETPTSAEKKPKNGYHNVGDDVNINGAKYKVYGYVTDENGKSIGIYRSYSDGKNYYIDSSGNMKEAMTMEIPTAYSKGMVDKHINIDGKVYTNENIKSSGIDSRANTNTSIENYVQVYKKTDGTVCIKDNQGNLQTVPEGTTYTDSDIPKYPVYGHVTDKNGNTIDIYYQQINSPTNPDPKVNEGKYYYIDSNGEYKEAFPTCRTQPQTVGQAPKKKEVISYSIDGETYTPSKIEKY